MNSRSIVTSLCSLLGAALLVCTSITLDAAAEGRPVAVSLQVSTRGLDPASHSGAQELYSRLKRAAWIACTRANRVGLEPSADPDACTERALGEAIRSVRLPLLTQVYLDTHSRRDAAAYGIEVPVHVATN